MMENIEREKRIALVLAGGYGGRIGMDTPKQFLTLGGKPVILHTLEVFQQHAEIDAMAVVCIPGWECFVQDLITEYGMTKCRWIFSGGKSSHESVCNGVQGLCSHCAESDIVLVHEAVRPFISPRIISDNIRMCSEYGNAITAVRDNEAVMYSEDGISSSLCFPRERMYKAQTPHTFRLKALAEVYEEARKRGIESQSLYTLMAELKHFPLYIVKGETRNMKLTLPEDIQLFEALLSQKNTGAF